MYIMDVPHVRNEDTKLQWRHQVHALAARIEEETRQNVARKESLRASIKLANDKRRALQRLLGHSSRRVRPPISGLDSLLTVQAAFMDDSARLTGAINQMADECEKRVAEGTGAAPKGDQAHPLHRHANWPCPTGSSSTSLRRPAAWW